MKKFFTCFIILFFTVGCTVFGRTPTFINDAKFSRGVSNCCYYIDGSASGYYNQIVDAAYNWENTGYGWNPIYMTAVASNYATHMDFYGRTPSTDWYLDNSTLGYCTYWYTDGTLVANRGNAPTTNYFYTEIIFNTDKNNSYDYRTAKHEMGHAFGLAHYASFYSIMAGNLADMYVTTVQQCDHDTINYLYN